MIGKLVQDIERTTIHKHRNIVYTKKTNMWSARLKSSIQSINYINKNYSPTYTCVCVCVYGKRERKKKEKEMLTNSICNVEDILGTLQN